MNTITKLTLLLFFSFIATKAVAQDSIPYRVNGFKIDKLIASKEKIKNQEREALKEVVEILNERYDKGEITEAEMQQLKKEAAQKHALNIEDRLAIIDSKIELLKRNEQDYDINNNGEDGFQIAIGGGDVTNFSFLNIKNKRKKRRYDRKTTSSLVFVQGINNTIIEGQSLSDSPYKTLGSGYVELGWAWRTRIFKNSNFARLKYGFSFQWNKLKPKDNLYFEQNGNETILTEFPVELDKSKFRVTNLVFPVHFEFGPSKKVERKTYFRYSTRRQFKIGLGGYAGFRVGAMQKLNYNENGDFVKTKIRRNYNASDFVYGLSGYVGIGEVSLYAKYDLNPLFKNQTVDQHNVSLGVRFDFL